MGDDKAPPDTHVETPAVPNPPPAEEIRPPRRLRNLRRIDTWGRQVKSYVN
jgi:hypothetical protein